ncbi:MAG: sulfite exporter TauE/SafE family protein [Tannerella sp.]|jgi:uncharacterized membrane protein YfcA|nr:sulfite exporter TauE/SafE family protein [Tannerella sp.]
MDSLFESFLSIQSLPMWGILFLSAFFIGMSKTGIQGINMLMIPLMAMAFGAKPSTGVILPMLCFSDLIAVLYYRRAAAWKYIFRLLPAALAGFAVAIAADSLVPPAMFKHLLAACLVIVMAVMLWSERGRRENRLTERWWYGPAFGLLGGFTTMIGNAAGPVMAIYLLSVKLPKYGFVGASAWFFLVVNYLKLPIQLFVWHNITASSLLLNLYTAPFMLLGAAAGIFLVRRLPEKSFRAVIAVITILSVIILMF